MVTCDFLKQEVHSSYCGPTCYATLHWTSIQLYLVWSHKHALTQSVRWVFIFSQRKHTHAHIECTLTSTNGKHVCMSTNNNSPTLRIDRIDTTGGENRDERILFNGPSIFPIYIEELKNSHFHLWCSWFFYLKKKCSNIAISGSLLRKFEVRISHTHKHTHAIEITPLVVVVVCVYTYSFAYHSDVRLADCETTDGITILKHIARYRRRHTHNSNTRVCVLFFFHIYHLASVAA